VEACQPTTTGGISIEELKHRAATLRQTALDSAPTNDPIGLETVSFDSQLQKGRQLAADVTQVLREIWSIEQGLRKEVDALRTAALKDPEAGAYAAEQKALFLEKIMFLLFVSGLLEAAKDCLLGVIEKLAIANLILSALAEILLNLSVALGDQVFQAFTNAQNAPGPPPSGATAPNPFAQPSIGKIIPTAAVDAISRAAANLARTTSHAQVSLDAAGRVTMEAAEELATCLALQQLALAALEGVAEAQEGLGDNGDQGGNNGEGGGSVEP